VKYGEVAHVTLYDLEEEGVVSVRFENSEAAQDFCSAMTGRRFNDVAVEAFIADGTERFKKTKKKFHKDDEERLEEFGDYIATLGDSDNVGDDKVHDDKVRDDDVGDGDEIR
jgi:HIV Tat-specific factor 1